MSDTSVPELAVSLLRAVEAGENTTETERELAALDREELLNALPDDRVKKAVWIDLYNAFAQLPLETNPRLFENRGTFFGAKRIPVAGRYLSLDDIEHGLLRRSQLSWGLGYLPDPQPSGFERALRVERRDPRIHFALNCGATSCPPIAAYTPEEIGSQLDLASESYLRGEVEFDRSKNVARVPRLCLWYYGDFRGRRGIRSLLRRYGVIGDSATPRIRYKGYDWSLDRGNFRKSLSLSAEEPRESATNGRPIDD
jgi:hypothetical protein